MPKIVGLGKTCRGCGKYAHWRKEDGQGPFQRWKKLWEPTEPIIFESGIVGWFHFCEQCRPRLEHVPHGSWGYKAQDITVEFGPPNREFGAPDREPSDAG